MKAIRYTTVILLLLGSLSFVHAQQAEEVNVKKQLKTVLKEMPYEAQLEVLRYAERKKDAAKALEAKRKEMAAQKKEVSRAKPVVAAPVQKQAAPQPPKAVEAKPVKVAPANSAVSSAPQVPKRPAYMEEASNMKPTQVEWMEPEFDFGKIKQGSVAKHTYKFRNTGDAPLKLTRVKASCGCTTPNWSKEEIAPGEEGFVEINFNSAGKLGPQHKSVTVTGNFEGTNQLLRFKGEVVKPEAGDNSQN